MRIIFIIICFVFNCSTSQEIAINPDIQPINDLGYIELIANMEKHIIEGEYNKFRPDTNGAIDRNKEGYFHVRFQAGILSLANYIIANDNIEAVEKYLSALKYSFTYQNENGNFLFNSPQNIEGSPSKCDSIGFTNFFLNPLGISLLALQDYRAGSEYNLSNFTSSLKLYDIKIKKSLDYLLGQRDRLYKCDIGFTNRIFAEAITFYTLGVFTEKFEAESLGIDLLAKALECSDSEGFFIEKDGYDSSYNGVSLKDAIFFYSLLDNKYRNIKKELWNSIIKCAEWQLSRVLASGEIRTDGNTRVCAGCEQYIGEEKKVAWSSSVKAFYMLYYYTKDNKYIKKAKLIENFYRNNNR